MSRKPIQASLKKPLPSAPQRNQGAKGVLPPEKGYRPRRATREAQRAKEDYMNKFRIFKGILSGKIYWNTSALLRWGIDSYRHEFARALLENHGHFTLEVLREIVLSHMYDDFLKSKFLGDIGGILRFADAWQATKPYEERLVMTKRAQIEHATPANIASIMDKYQSWFMEEYGVEYVTVNDHFIEKFTEKRIAILIQLDSVEDTLQELI